MSEWILAAEEMIQGDEGTKLFPYRDTEGFLTIGTGRNLDANGISKDEAAFLFRSDMTAVIQDLWLHIPYFNVLSDNRKVVLANMRFNLGLPRFMGFKKMLAALDQKDFERAADEIMDSKAARQLRNRYLTLESLMRLG